MLEVAAQRSVPRSVPRRALVDDGADDSQPESSPERPAAQRQTVPARGRPAVRRRGDKRRTEADSPKVSLRVK